MTGSGLSSRDRQIPAGVVAARIARMLIERPAVTRVAVYWTEEQLRVVPFEDQVLQGVTIIGFYDPRSVTVQQLVEDLA